MRKLWPLLLLAVLFSPPTRTCAQRLPKGLDSLFYGKQGIHTRYPALGLSIGVVRGPAVAYYALGNTQPTQGVPVDSTTLFEVGSVTKTFTALLLAYDQEIGKVPKDAYLEALLPPTVRLRPGLRHRVTLTAMASHQSGLPNLSNDRYIQALIDQDSVQPFHVVSRDYLFKLLRETDSLHAPGTYHYNNFAFSLLGTLLAQRAGCSYGELVQQRIVRPLGLRTTGLTYHTARIAGRFTTKGDARPAIVINELAPAGGLKSNAVDLVRYVRAQLVPPRAPSAGQLCAPNNPFTGTAPSRWA